MCTSFYIITLTCRLPIEVNHPEILLYVEIVKSASDGIRCHPAHMAWSSPKYLVFLTRKYFSVTFLKCLLFSKTFVSTLKDIFERIKKIHNPTNLANNSCHTGRGINLTEHHDTFASAAGGSTQKINWKIFAFQL